MGRQSAIELLRTINNGSTHLQIVGESAVIALDTVSFAVVQVYTGAIIAVFAIGAKVSWYSISIFKYVARARTDH